MARFPLLLLLALCVQGPARAVSCKVLEAHAPSDAEQAFLAGHYDHAIELYRAQLEQRPNDAVLIAGMEQVLLRQQKMAEAAELVNKAVAANADSVVLLTALGEVQFRQGTPWAAASTAEKAMKLDPCYPRLRLLLARVLRVNSMYGRESREIATAHLLDPHDPGIRLQWLESLPIQQRIAELETYLAAGTGDDPEALMNLRFYLERLKKGVAEPHKACRLVSQTAATQIPFAAIMHDANHIASFGLDVKLNDRNARLQIDTGAGGLVITRAVAERAGLKRFANGQLGGIGGEGERAAYTAYADSIRIGALEFRDCEVEVIDKRSVLEVDGLIGMDVFSRFLVTLDYPMRKLALAPLPPRPDDVAVVQPTLKTGESEGDEPDSEDNAGDDTSSGAQAKKEASKLPLPVARGPHDRYVAPEMKDWTPVYRVGHNLIVPTLLNKKETKLFILDTGAFSTTISPAVARQVTKVHEDDQITVKGISGKVDKVYAADNLDFRFGNVDQPGRDIVAFETPQVSKGIGMEIAGFIGATTLGQLTMTIDYRDALVRFSYDANRGYRNPTGP